MRTSDADILIIPGLGGSGPDIGKAAGRPSSRPRGAVEQKDWDHPRLADWRDAISNAVAEAERPVILVAHSLGATTVADIAAALGDKVKGAFLVAPALLALGQRDRGNRPPPLPKSRPQLCRFRAFSSRAAMIPYASFAESEDFARAWQAEIADAGNAGHINAASGHGPWPEGLMRLAGFLKNL